MTSGNDDPGDDGDVLSPEELDITQDEHVAEIDDGRYVVSPNEPIEDVPGHVAGDEADRPTGTAGAAASGPGRSADPPPDQDPGTASDPAPDPARRRPGTERTDPSRAPAGTGLSEADVRRWHAAQFDAADSRYGFDVTATFDGNVQHRQMVSNDVVTIFESLVLWYAQQIDSATPVEEVLGILLMEASVPVRYPSASLQRTLESTDLTPEDSIADLVEAVGEDGFRI